jgi:hypothetical protein
MMDGVRLSGSGIEFTAGNRVESAHKVTADRQRCAKNAEGEQPNVFLNMYEKADWLV